MLIFKGSDYVNSLRCLEKLFGKNEYIEDINFFPILVDDDFTYMDIKAMQKSDRITCFTFYGSYKGEPYIDVYIWDVMLPYGYQRFVIKEGYALEPRDEDVFLEYLYQDILIDEKLLEYVVKMVDQVLPQIHIKKYSDSRHTLLHIYFTLHRTGPSEILYKANFNYLATGLKDVEDYNLIGTSPQGIFGVQIGMLRAMNSRFGCGVLISEKNREMANAIYAAFHNYITGRILNECQWRYLVTKFEMNEPINRRELDYLGKLENISQYYTFRRYIGYKELVDDYYANLPKYPDSDELEENAKICDKIKFYIEQEKAIDYHLKKKMLSIKENYTFATNDYFVMIPSTLKELLKEAECQHNCLYKYIMCAAFDDNEAIVFVRSKKTPTKSLVTVEIEDGRIQQAFCAFNKVPDEQQQQFLKAFAEAKGLIICDDFDNDWWDDDEEERD